MRPICPFCRSSVAVRPAHRRYFDGLLKFISFHAFRCDACTLRFYRFRRPRVDVIPGPQ
jgi:hypothetical protein